MKEERECNLGEKVVQDPPLVSFLTHQSLPGLFVTRGKDQSEGPPKDALGRCVIERNG